MLGLSSNLTQTVFVYLCICVFVFVYLDVRHLGTLFLRSSYHFLFKNISHHGSFQSVSKFLILLPTNHKRGIKKGQNQGKERHLSEFFFGFFLSKVNLHQKRAAPIYIRQKVFSEPVQLHTQTRLVKILAHICHIQCKQNWTQAAS